MSNQCKECSGSRTHRSSARGHLDCLEWLHAHGCPHSKDTSYFALIYGTPETFDYCIDNDCPWEEDYEADDDLVHMVDYC